MVYPESLVEGAELLIARLGYWPDFHDWEVRQFALYRKGLAVDCMIYIETPPGSAQVFNVTLNCVDVSSIELGGFNHQNVIGALTVRRVDAGAELAIEALFGVALTLVCAKIAVSLDAR